MLPLRGGFRLFRAVTSTIGWPTRVEIATPLGPDTEQIQVFRERDRVTSPSPHWTVENDDDDADAWSERWKAVIAKSNDFTLNLSSMYLSESNLLIPANLSICNPCYLQLKALYSFG